MQIPRFLVSKDLMNKPGKIWNEDKTGFSFGSIASKVVGAKNKTQSHILNLAKGRSKQHFTAMFCGCADSTVMLSSYIYPQPNPRGYDWCHEG